MEVDCVSAVVPEAGGGGCCPESFPAVAAAALAAGAALCWLGAASLPAFGLGARSARFARRDVVVLVEVDALDRPVDGAASAEGDVVAGSAGAALVSLGFVFVLGFVSAWPGAGGFAMDGFGAGGAGVGAA